MYWSCRLETRETQQMKRMLFNATHPEELRVAIVDGQKLLDLDIESSTHHQKKGNIYKGRITRVEPSLEAAFVDYGSERQGFLPLKEISRSYFQDYSSKTPMAQVRIQDVVKEGQELLVQVEKDERGNKGAALTTFISLAGRFLVLMPCNPKGGGISRRIEGDNRSELRDAMNQLKLPTEHALIARTAGIGKSVEELQWDLDFLLQLWEAIRSAADERAGSFLVYQETNIVVRAIRDYLRNDTSEIIIDDKEIFDRAMRFMEQVMPHHSSKLKHYRDTIPLFSRFQIEHQIESAFSREVKLPSGGALIIDHTEALVTIDVNSARATKGADIEETALHTNLEAADEVARQLRIRDLGGLIVIDFIDMTINRNQRTVENRLQEALKVDRARVQVGRISRFGMLEMSRQRLRASLGESNYIACPRCAGTGHIRGIASSALHILRIIEEEALKENTEAIHAHLPTDTATYLLNEKRSEVSLVENRLGTRIFIIPTPELETPNFQIRRLRAEEVAEIQQIPSYKIVRQEPEPQQDYSTPERLKEVAAVGLEQMQTTAPPEVRKTEERGRFKTFLGKLFGTEQEVVVEEKEKPAPSAQIRKQPSSGGRGNRSRRGGQTRRSNRPQSAQRQQPKKSESASGQTGGEADGQKPRGQGRAKQSSANRPNRGSRSGGSSSGGARQSSRGRSSGARGRQSNPVSEATADTAQRSEQVADSRPDNPEKTVNTKTAGNEKPDSAKPGNDAPQQQVESPGAAAMVEGSVKSG
jgi:ribonuclease E